MLEIIAGQFEDMTSNISAEELAKVKEFMIKDATANLKKNTAWEGAMEGYCILPVNTFTNAVDEINAITEDDVNDINRLYAHKEALEESSRFIAENSKETLAQVYAEAFTNAVDEINAITEDDVKTYMKEFMKQNNYRVFIMDPETAE